MDQTTSSMIYFLGIAAFIAGISFMLITLYIFTNNTKVRRVLVTYDKIKVVIQIIYLFAASSAILLTHTFFFQPYYEYFVLVIMFMTVSNAVTNVSITVLHYRRKKNPKIKQLTESLLKTQTQKKKASLALIVNH